MLLHPSLEALPPHVAFALPLTAQPMSAQDGQARASGRRRLPICFGKNQTLVGSAVVVLPSSICQLHACLLQCLLDCGVHGCLMSLLSQLGNYATPCCMYIHLYSTAPAQSTRMW